jgi:hypothetical protein
VIRARLSNDLGHAVVSTPICCALDPVLTCEGSGAMELCLMLIAPAPPGPLLVPAPEGRDCRLCEGPETETWLRLGFRWSPAVQS